MSVRRRLRALFRRRSRMPDEPVAMEPDPEWDELLAWADVPTASHTIASNAPSATSPPPGNDEEDLDWTAAIARAKAEALAAAQAPPSAVVVPLAAPIVPPPVQPAELVAGAGPEVRPPQNPPSAMPSAQPEAPPAHAGSPSPGESPQQPPPAARTGPSTNAEDEREWLQALARARLREQTEAARARVAAALAEADRGRQTLLQAEEAERTAAQAARKRQQPPEAAADDAEWAAALARAKREKVEQPAPGQQAAKQTQPREAGGRPAAPAAARADDAEWAAALERAKQRHLESTPPRGRPTIDIREWEERIARARKPTPRPANDTRPTGTPSLLERLDRLAAQVDRTKAREPASEEQRQWRAAISRAKKGNA